MIDDILESKVSFIITHRKSHVKEDADTKDNFFIVT